MAKFVEAVGAGEVTYYLNIDQMLYVQELKSAPDQCVVYFVDDKRVTIHEPAGAFVLRLGA